MNDSTLLNKALKSCQGNKTLLGARLGTSRQVVTAWIRKKSLPDWRRDGVLALVKGEQKSA